MNIHYISILASTFIVFATSCKSWQTNDSGLKHVPGVNELRNSEVNQRALLINHLFKDIKYAILFDGSPSNSGKCVQLKDARVAIEDAYHLWIDSLIDRLEELKINLNGKLGRLTLSGELSEADLVVDFKCKSGRSSTSNSKAPIKIDLELRTKSDDNFRKIGDFKFSVLVHEMGHAFGLADLYHYEDSSFSVGDQPVDSIMYSSKKFKVPQQDDIDGLVWLYSFYVLKSIKRTDCIHGYKYDVQSKGCIPISEASDHFVQKCLHAGGTYKMNTGDCVCPNLVKPIHPDFSSEACDNVYFPISLLNTPILVMFKNTIVQPNSIWLWPKTGHFKIKVRKEYSNFFKSTEAVESLVETVEIGTSEYSTGKQALQDFFARLSRISNSDNWWPKDFEFGHRLELDRCKIVCKLQDNQNVINNLRFIDYFKRNGSFSYGLDGLFSEQIPLPSDNSLRENIKCTEVLSFLEDNVIRKKTFWNVLDCKQK